MSTTVTKPVKLKGKVVEEKTIVQYESVAEAIETKDEKFILGLINRQLVTDEMNATRAQYREAEPGKKKRYEVAFNLLPTLTINGKDGMDLLIECAGDKSKLDALLMSDEVQAAVSEKLGTEE